MKVKSLGGSPVISPVMSMRVKGGHLDLSFPVKLGGLNPFSISIFAALLTMSFERYVQGQV